MKELCDPLTPTWFRAFPLQRKRETSDTDGELSLPNTPSVEEAKKEKKKKKKAKQQEAEGLEQETVMEVWRLNLVPWLLLTKFSC